MFGLAACGSSGSSYSAPPTTGTASAAPAAGAVAVTIRSGTDLGAVLADADGRTLYTLTNNGRPVPCTGQCAAVWPPLLVPADIATATTAAGVNGIATTMTGAGVQVTKDGQPLYRFSGDKTPGATKGDGIVNFGGEWRAVRSGGATPATQSPVVGGGSSGY